MGAGIAASRTPNSTAGGYRVWWRT